MECNDSNEKSSMDTVAERLRFASVHSLEICLAKSTLCNSVGSKAACSKQMVYGVQKEAKYLVRANSLSLSVYINNTLKKMYNLINFK